MSSTKFCHTLVSFLKATSRWSNDDTNKVGIIKALTWKHKHVLFGHQLLAKLDIRTDILELVHIDAHHHVHGSLWGDRCQAINLGNCVNTQLGIVL